MKGEVTVIDYGIGNIFSICNALEYCGGQVQLTADPRRAATAERLVLPGVGAFANGMAELVSKGFGDAIQAFARHQRPFLGICLGMQMMLDWSEEFGRHRGLGLIGGKVVPIDSMENCKKSYKIPHIGWSAIRRPPGGRPWEGTLLDNTAVGTACYFVHSFVCVTDTPLHTTAVCDYHDLELTAVISKDTLWGCQYHPEKSGTQGLGMLERFLLL